MVVLGWIRGFSRGWDVGPCAFLGAAIGLLSLSHYFAYGLILISIFVFFASARRLGFSWGLLSPVWHRIRGRLCHLRPVPCEKRADLLGDFLGMRSYSECAELYAQQEDKPSVHQTLKMSGELFMSSIFDSTWLWMTFRSCIAYFGYMAYPIPEVLYLPIIALCCVGLALPAIVRGLLVPKSCHDRLGNGRFADKLLAFALIAATVFPLFSRLIARGRRIGSRRVAISYRLGSRSRCCGCGVSIVWSGASDRPS